MRPLPPVLSAISLLAVLVSPALALDDQLKCDKVKGKVAGKLVGKVINCHTKPYTEPGFDVGGCVNDAIDKCVAKFDKADAKFDSCAMPGNGQALCAEIASQATFFWQQL
jgi:hypothetical protein